MSTDYKNLNERVPTETLAKRLDELSHAVTEGREAVLREFTMRVPAELDRDADLVLSAAAARLREFLATERAGLPITELLSPERECCGTFAGSPHRATCEKYRGKFKPANAGGEGRPD